MKTRNSVPMEDVFVGKDWNRAFHKRVASIVVKNCLHSREERKHYGSDLCRWVAIYLKASHSATSGHSDGLFCVITATEVHIKSINVQDISIWRSFSTGTGNWHDSKKTNLNRCGVTVDDMWCQNKLIETADDVMSMLLQGWVIIVDKLIVNQLWGWSWPWGG